VICQAAKDRWSLLADGDRLSKRDFILDLAEAGEKLMTDKHIGKGWEATGLYPLNSDQVFPNPSTPMASLTPLDACRCLQNTDLHPARWMRTADQYPDLPSPVKRLASQLADKHTVNRTNKLILQRQLSDYKEEVAELH
jgi:hypothetical protein